MSTEHHAHIGTTGRRGRVRKIAIATAIAITGVGATTQTTQAAGELAWLRYSWLGPRGVEVAALVADTPGDIYCTSASVRVFDAAGRQLGSEINLGSVCGGRTAWTDIRPVRTTAGDIQSVKVIARRGSGGPIVDVVEFRR
jgi:hypothetical protein